MTAGWFLLWLCGVVLAVGVLVLVVPVAVGARARRRRPRWVAPYGMDGQGRMHLVEQLPGGPFLHLSSCWCWTLRSARYTGRTGRFGRAWGDRRR